MSDFDKLRATAEMIQSDTTATALERRAADGLLLLLQHCETLQAEIDDARVGESILRQDVENMRAERAVTARLRAGLCDAISEVEEWTAYASEYFRVKHDLAGTLRRLRGYLE